MSITNYNKVQAQLSDYIKSEYPLMAEFLSAYYDFLDLQISPSKEETIYSDVDSAIDSFKEYFYNEILTDIPKNVIVNKALLSKHIKELYVSKGSENSFRTLFRAIYNKEIGYNIPGEEILKSSDGRWYQDFSIIIKIPNTITISDVNKAVGNKILVSILGKQLPVSVVRIVQVGSYVALVDSNGGQIYDAQGTAIYVADSQSNTFEFFIVKDFNDVLSAGDIISFNKIINLNVLAGGSKYTSASGIEFNAIDGGGAAGGVHLTNGIITSTTITNAGYGYITAPTVSVSGIGSGAYIVAELGELFSGTILNSIKSPTVTQLTNSFIEGTILPIGANGAILKIKRNSRDRITKNTSIMAFGLNYADSFNYVIPENSTVATATALLSNGSVNEIKVNFGGTGYVSAPTVYIEGNAVFTANISGGSIISFTKVSGGSGYTVAPAVYFSTNSLVLKFTSSALRTYEGYYNDSHGMPSGDMYIYDGRYYQDYSYEIAIDELFSSYKNAVKKLLHPAGYGLFGIYEQSALIYSPISVEKLSLDKNINTIDRIQVSDPFSVFIEKIITESISTPDSVKFATTKNITETISTSSTPEIVKFTIAQQIVTDTAVTSETIVFAITKVIDDNITATFLSNGYYVGGYIDPTYYETTDVFLS